jgi:hypothetical protein
MLGKPKFNLNDVVSFSLCGKKKQGIIYIIDKYGTFFDKSDVSYDIFVEEENMLYKHINENFVEKVLL